MSKQESSTLSPHVATILPQSLIDDLRLMIDQTKEEEKTSFYKNMGTQYYVSYICRKTP